MRPRDAKRHAPACLDRCREASARRAAWLVAAWRDAQPGALPPAASAAGMAMSRETPEMPGLDGRVPMVIGGTTLHQLRCVAGRSECSLAEMLLAVFGLVLDRLGAWRDTSITVLPSSGALDGPVRGEEGREGQQGEGSAMPAEMLDAISRQAVPEPRDGGEDPAIAFRYVRRWSGEERLSQALMLPPGMARLHYALFDLVLEVNEFDDRILVECFFCSAGTPSSAVGRLLHAYVRDLYVVASSFVDGA